VALTKLLVFTNGNACECQTSSTDQTFYEVEFVKTICRDLPDAGPRTSVSASKPTPVQVATVQHAAAGGQLRAGSRHQGHRLLHGALPGRARDRLRHAQHDGLRRGPVRPRHGGGGLPEALHLLQLLLLRVLHFGMGVGFAMSAAAMLVGVISLLAGASFYRNKPPKGSIFTPIARVRASLLIIAQLS
jgi:hypothetical protein